MLYLRLLLYVIYYMYYWSSAVYNSWDDGLTWSGSYCEPESWVYTHKPNPNISDMINILILMGKYHIHGGKLRNNNPSFTWIINESKNVFCVP